jgi:Tfp pilus assembly protein PilF
VQAASQLLDRVAAWSEDPDSALDHAERAVRRAIAIDPRQPQVNVIYGAVMAIRGRHEEALAAFDAELELGRYHEPQVYNWIGLTRLLMGEPANAVEPFAMAVWLSPRDPRLSYFRRNLALAHLHAGDTRRALVVAREAVRTTPPARRAYETLAAACVLAGEDCAPAVVAELRRVAPGYGLEDVAKEVSSTNPRYLAARKRYLEALREAGL